MHSRDEALERFVDSCRLKLSYTRLTAYLDCPRKYRMLYIEKVKTPRTDALLLGGGVHDALEKYTDSGCTTLAELSGLFASYLKRKEEQEGITLDEEKIAAANLMLRDWWEDTQQKVTPAEIYVETYFEKKYDTCLMRGYIDRIEVEDGVVRIIDYKTGKNELSGKALREDLQLPIYHMAAQDLFPDKQVKTAFYYLRSGNFKEVEFTKADLVRVENKIESTAVKIINDTKYLPTWSGFKCRFCPLHPDWCDWPERRPQGRKKN